MSKILFIIISGLLVANIFPAKGYAKISCKEYGDHIHRLETILPNLSPEERCNKIPTRCGTSWLLFNPEGMETYYYRSQCFMELAIEKLEEKYCNQVVERGSLFLDGSYFSRKACLEKIHQMKSDEKAPKVSPQNIHRIKSVLADAKNGKLKIRLELTNSSISGKYALSFSAKYNEGHVKVFHSLNPEADEIIYDKSFKRFSPINNWIINIKNAQKQIDFIVSENNFSRVKKAIDLGKPVEFEIALQFLESSDNSIADIKKQEQYVSKYIFSQGDLKQ